MQIDGEEQSLNIRFRALPYSVETGEAEMITMDTITRTGKNAAIRESKPATESKKTDEKNGTSKTKAKGEEEPPLLSPEDEERKSSLPISPLINATNESTVIASLTTRLNAIRTLQSRISLIKTYVTILTAEDAKPEHLSHPILRHINSLLSQLSLLTPHEQSPLFAETQRQHEDVLMVSMLGQLSQHIRAMRDLGKKTATLHNARQSAMTRKAFQSRFEEEYFRDSPGSSDMFS